MIVYSEERHMTDTLHRLMASVARCVYNQMGLLNNGRCPPLELEVQQVAEGQTDCE